MSGGDVRKDKAAARKRRRQGRSWAEGGAGPLEKESELQKIQPSETSNSCRRSRSTELAERLITKEDMRGRRTPDAAKISMSHNVRRSEGRCVSRNWQAREK